MFVYLGASVFVVLHMMDVLRPFKVRYVLMGVYILIMFSMFFGRAFGSKLPLFLGVLCTRIGYMWIALLTYTFLFSLIFLVLRLFHIGPVTPKARLIFFTAEVATCLVLLLVGWLTALNVKVTRHSIVADKGVNMRVVQLSDLHLGIQNSERQLAKIVDKVNGLNPDMVVISGDLLENENGYAELKHIGNSMRKLNPVYGVWAVNGNHEYISGIERSVAYIQSLDIKLLRDSCVVIDDNILLIGQEDPTLFRRTRTAPKTLDELITPEIAEAIPKRFTMVLTHQVHSHKPYENRGFDLVMSGHTHHGQLFPFNLVVKRVYDIAYGLQKRGDSYFYVTSGTGIWGPAFRLGTISEIVVFDVSVP